MLARGVPHPLKGLSEGQFVAQVVFPERPGALRTFLSTVSPRWNITLFHYRKTGKPSLAPLSLAHVHADAAAD